MTQQAAAGAAEEASVEDDQERALEEFRYAASRYCEAPSTGTRYALEMAAEECRLLGLDPERITPTGYDQ